MPQLHSTAFVTVTTNEAFPVGLLLLFVLVQLLELLLGDVSEVALRAADRWF